MQLRLQDGTLIRIYALDEQIDATKAWEMDEKAEPPLALRRALKIARSWAAKNYPHFDEVRSPPAPWKTLASTDRCDVHIMRYGEKNIWGIQAHPEIPPDDAIVLLNGFVEKFPEKADLIRPALESEPRDDGIAYTIVSRFLELP